VLFWALAILVPMFVALSRLYRGMHHASDVVASVLLAAASLACAIMVTRVTSAAATHPVKELSPPRATVSHEVPA
jgi:undecaprenyl-diphosphatase